LPSYYAIFFNQGKQEALKDPVVRKALHDAIRPNDVVAHALNDLAIPIERPLDAMLGENNIPNRPGIEEIKTALDVAGWKDNGSGLRAKTEGKSTTTLQIVLTVPKIQFLQKTAAEAKAAWEAIGVKTEIQEIAPEEILEKAVKTREYEAILFGNILNPPLDLYAFWHTSERFPPGLNLSIYSEKKADTLIEGIRRELNQEKRTSMLKELSALIASDYPAIFLYTPHYFVVSTKDLKGLNQGLMMETSDRFLTVNKWHLKTTRRLK
jgi:peptide/nickel transport system substrate-binding protein